MTRSQGWFGIAEAQLETHINDFSAIGGSSSGETIRINTTKGPYFIKIAPYSQLEAEYIGLQTLSEKAAIRIPRIFGFYPTDDSGLGLLILEFISSAGTHSNSRSWDSFLEMLKRLHSVKGNSFGWKTPNFIGRLDQPNGSYNSWSEFFIEKRLHEQWNKGLSEGAIPKTLQNSYEDFIQHAQNELDSIEISPTLLHGDLWSGNIMFDQNGEAVFIDPSVYFGHGEVDLAMMDLFGGFPPYLTETYLEGDVPPGYENRKLIYQLYYQLVHVRLFGAGYLNAVERIIKI